MGGGGTFFLHLLQPASPFTGAFIWLGWDLAGAQDRPEGRPPSVALGDGSLTCITQQQPTLRPCSLVWVLCPASLSWAAGTLHSEGLRLTGGISTPD